MAFPISDLTFVDCEIFSLIWHCMSEISTMQSSIPTSPWATALGKEH